MERIIERFKTLTTKLKSDKPPEREFFMRYPDEMAEDLFETGLLSKTKWTQHQKDASAPVGDWNCSYCSFSAECYPEGADTDISGDKNLVNRNVRLSEEDGEKFLKSGKLPVVA